MVMGQRTPWGIPFDAINAAALGQLSSLLREWFPNGKAVGHEYRVGSINGEAGESFSVNMQTGKWAEFNGRGETGGDVIGLYAAKFCHGDRAAAALDLADEVGIEIKQRARPEPKPKAKSDDGQWFSLIPPPADAGRPSATMLSGLDIVHCYTSLDDRETHFVGRIEARGDERKQFIPFTYGELDGKRGWHRKAPNPPRPLYGLNRLTTMPDAAVILCEGEKAADAAQRLFSDHACISWFGGTAQVEHVDLGPLANRRVIVWPDADESGHNAMHKLIPRLPANTRVVRTDGLPEAFDAADLDCDDPAAWLNERLVPVSEFRGDGQSPDDADEKLSDPDLSITNLSRRAPPKLPIEVFGPDWGQWIAEAAEAAACPSDYVAAALVAAASALIGHARWAQATPGWCEPPHLWCGMVGDSGVGKSPGTDCLRRDVLPEIERRMNADFPDQLLEWKVQAEKSAAKMAIWKEEVRAAEKQNRPPPRPPDDAPPEPQSPRLRQSDVTIEKVAGLLATAAPKGLLIERDELSGWLLGLNTYNDAGRPFWIEAYGGRQYRVERQKTPQPIIIPRLAVAVCGGTQPERLAGLFRDADDGLLARFCWWWPEPLVFRLGRTAPNADWATTALDRLRRLDLAITPEGSRPVMVPLEGAALPELEDFGAEMQSRQHSAGGLMRSALGKARGTALRLALVLEHLWWCGRRDNVPPPASISRFAFLGAATLVADYLMRMAERVYGDAAATDAERRVATLARWVIKERAKEVHVRHLQREVRLPGLRTADAIRDTCERMVEAGWLIPPNIGFGAASKVAYLVNPLVLGDQP